MSPDGDPHKRPRKGQRVLDREERRLWTYIARDVVPLERKYQFHPDVALLPLGPETAGPAINGNSARMKPVLNNSRPVALAPYASSRSPGLEALERKTLSALRRGKRGVDAKIDLHGLYQQDAHSSLNAFLHRSQLAGHSLVLVVTGKGPPASSLFSGPPSFEGRGILRRMTPHWLAAPELHSVVIGYDEAATHHGGAGAFYVRLRRLKA